MKHLAETSWAYCGTPFARRCSKGALFSEDDLFCFEILMDVSKWKDHPEGKNTIRRIGLLLTFEGTPPISVTELQEKLQEDFHRAATKTYVTLDTLGVAAEEYVNFSEYNVQFIGQDVIWKYSNHLINPFTLI